MHTQPATVIRKCRKRQGLTQRELGEKCGMGQQNVARLERDGYNGCRVDTLQLVAQAMGRRLVISMEPD